MKAPCKNCILIPICRHKYFVDMKNQCEPIKDFLTEVVVDDNYIVHRNRKNLRKRLKKINSTLKPSKWDVKSSLGFSDGVLVLLGRKEI